MNFRRIIGSLLRFPVALLILLLDIFGSNCQARVFNFDQYHVATYFKGNAGVTAVGQQAYQFDSGASTVFANAPKYNLGGEIGLLFASKKIGLRVGYELVEPQKMSGIIGANSAGTPLLNLSSSALAQFPVAYVEFYPASTPTHRFVIALGAGWGSVTMENDYSNATGYGVANYVEKGKSASTYLAEASISYDMDFVDSVSVIFDLGYRYIPVRKFTATNSFTNVYGHTVNVGNPLTNADGSDRTLNLSGMFAGVGFRFFFK